MLKALESEPSRRYESVRALAGDLESVSLGARHRPSPDNDVSHREIPAPPMGSGSAAAVFMLGLAGASVFAVHQARAARAESLKLKR